MLLAKSLLAKNNFKDDNLYFDTTTIQLISNYRLKKEIDYVGIDKILFGTDMPRAKDYIPRNINRTKNLETSSTNKDLTLGLNMKRLLQL